MTAQGMPAHWVQVRLDCVAEVRLGRQRSPERATGPNMVPYLRAANVTWLGIDLSDVKEMDFTPAEVETYRLRDGDILLSEASGSPGEVGKPARYSIASGLHCFQNTLIRVRAGDELVRFSHLHFLRDALLGRFAKASRGVGIHHLGAEALTAWQISVPPVGEQHRIVDSVDSYLTRLDAAVATLEAAQTKLKAYRASVLKAAVEGHLVPTEASLARAERRDFEPADVLLKRILDERRRRWEEAELAKLKAAGKAPKDDKWKAKYEEPVAPDVKGLPELPEGWCWASVEQLASNEPRSIQSGPFGSNLLHSEFQPEGKLVVGIDNVQDGFFSMGAGHRISKAKFEELEQYRARGGDVLVTVMATVGRTCVIPDDLEPAIITKHVYRITPARELMEPRYLHLALWGGPVVRSQMFAQVIGQTRPGLNGGIIRQLAIPLPPRPEQVRIADEVERFLSFRDQIGADLEQAGRRIHRLRQAVLKWAFEGKLVDQDPNDEPAEKLLERIRIERADTETSKVTSRARTAQ